MEDSSDRISPEAQLSPTAIVWDHALVREHAILGERVIVGAGAYIGVGVRVGDDSKIQNGAQVYEPAEIGPGVFIGPGAILTNDRFPRAVTPSMMQKTADDWESVGVTVLYGASIGAGAICVAPVTIGCWAMVAAGSVVTRDVPDHALVVGNPARRIGWVGRAGVRLEVDLSAPNSLRCPVTGEAYEERDSRLVRVEGLGS